jgi:hypothetical protein
MLFGDRWSSALQKTMQQSASSGGGCAEAGEERAAAVGGSVPRAAAESAFDLFDG